MITAYTGTGERVYLERPFSRDVYLWCKRHKYTVYTETNSELFKLSAIENAFLAERMIVNDDNKTVVLINDSGKF